MNHEKFAVIDVETPNCHNDSICSLGIVIIENGDVTKKLHYLINPETDFDEMNISIHGITPETIKGEPIFPEVWERVKALFSECLLAGHNLKFDLSCIKKTMQKYQIEAAPVYFIDTLTLSRKYMDDVSCHKLNVLCDCFGIPLDNHHDALCDSTATAELLLSLIEVYDIDIDEYITKYDFRPVPPVIHKTNYTESTKALQELQGVLNGVICDNVLNDSEILFIEEWLRQHKELKGNYPYDKIYTKIKEVLEDGIITENEKSELFILIYRIINPVEESAPDLCIQIKDSNICLTGEFECMQKKELSMMLESMGAIIKNTVSKSLDYLFVGDKGSDKWSQGNYGTKIKKAMELNEKGGNIQILKEKDVVSCLIDE